MGARFRGVLKVFFLKKKYGNIHRGDIIGELSVIWPTSSFTPTTLLQVTEKIVSNLQVGRLDLRLPDD